MRVEWTNELTEEQTNEQLEVASPHETSFLNNDNLSVWSFVFKFHHDRHQLSFKLDLQKTLTEIDELTDKRMDVQKDGNSTKTQFFLTNCMMIILCVKFH